MAIRHGTLIPAGAALAVFAVACGDGETPPDRGRSGPDARPAQRGAATPARYVTDIAFISLDPTPTSLYLRFRNRVTSESLVRDYRGWLLDPDDWSDLLTIRDTLPTPRAGWRVLPAEGLRVLVGPGGELTGLGYRGGGRDLRLTLDSTVTEWSGPTGQRERLRRATLSLGGAAESGLVLERRLGLPVGGDGPRGEDSFFLASDGDGGGLLVLRHVPAPVGDRVARVDSTAMMYRWERGRVTPWPVVVSVESREGDEPVEWAIEAGVTTLSGRLRGMAGAGQPSLPAERLRGFSLRGTMRFQDRERAVRGIGVITRRP